MEAYQHLAERYGTPLYVHEMSEVRSAHAALRASLPDESTLYYSLKANPHPEVAAELSRAGCRAEVSSTGEFAAAISAGYQADQCLYTGS